MSPAAEAEAPWARRPKRADGRRNYDAILDAARVAFAERGTGASLEDIAKSAGVAIGTLYGHFPTRETLVEATIREQLDQLDQAAAAQADGDGDPLGSLTTWMRLAVEHCSTYRGLASFLAGSTYTAGAPLHHTSVTVHKAAAPLLARAKQADRIREDVTAEELYAVITAAAWARENSPASTDHSVRLMAFMVAGMSPSAEVPARA